LLVDQSLSEAFENIIANSVASADYVKKAALYEKSKESFTQQSSDKTGKSSSETQQTSEQASTETVQAALPLLTSFFGNLSDMALQTEKKLSLTAFYYYNKYYNQ